MEDKVKELEKKVAELTIIVEKLTEELENLKSGSLGSGVYFEGVSDYNKEYILGKEGK